MSRRPTGSVDSFSHLRYFLLLFALLEVEHLHVSFELSAPLLEQFVFDTFLLELQVVSQNYSGKTRVNIWVILQAGPCDKSVRVVVSTMFAWTRTSESFECDV